jgi:phage tail-like protein
MRRQSILVVLALGAALAAFGAAEVRGAEFAVNATRFDPYKQFKFRVKWDGRYIPGIRVVSGLTRTTEVVTSRPGGAPSTAQRSPGQTTYEPIVLERGRTHDTAFEDWTNKVWRFGSGLGSEASLGDFRKDMIIEMYNEAGQLALAWKVYRCWPSAYSAVNRLDANSTEVALESMTLEHEGWERDTEVVEPTEPAFGAP